MQRVEWEEKLHFEGEYMMHLYPGEYDPADFIVKKTGSVKKIDGEFLYIFGDDGEFYKVNAKIVKPIY